jgi:hypothetical protein
VVFADFPRPVGGAGRPVEVPLAADAPMLREWGVVVTAPALSVALSAWEVPTRSGSLGHGAFESIFTFDPAAVRTAAGVCLAVARASGTVPGPLLETIGSSLAPEPTPSHGVDSLVVRAFGYLQAVASRADRPGSP